MNAKTVFGRVRRDGIRVHGGPWTVSGMPDDCDHLVVALGRAAGPAVVRSRMRRIARDVFLREEGQPPRRRSVLIMARASLAHEPRRRVRIKLEELKLRLEQAIEVRTPGGGSRAPR